MRKQAHFIWLILLIMAFMLLSGLSFAQALPPEAAALFQAALPSHTVALSDQCGYTAVAVMTDGANQTLCLAEQKNGMWEMTVCNPAALRQDIPVTSLHLDTDETLFWSYNTYGEVSDRYHAVRIDGQWRVASLMTSEIHDSSEISEYHLSFESGCLYYRSYFCDENENILSKRSFVPVPAAWLEPLMSLDVYDDSQFPKPILSYTHSWLPENVAAMAAAELFPGDTFLGGCAKKEHLEFFLQKPNGERVIAICRPDEMGDWNIALSTPLPQGTSYRLENFSSALVIGDLLVSVGPVDKNTCGITFIYNISDDLSGTPMFSLGKNRITGESPNRFGHCYGDHPWSDITAMNWNSLPQSLESALEIMDSSAWAVVSNPDPNDRLHLRASPDRGAKSLGKYYNGTPMRILETKGDWVRVEIFGISGWMMKKYLVFGNDGYQTEATFPSCVPVNPTSHHYVYAEPSRDQPAFCASCEDLGESLLVLGVVDDEWYHVWFPQGEQTGYVEQRCWYEGNG